MVKILRACRIPANTSVQGRRGKQSGLMYWKKTPWNI
jgi:hypothetical protein